MSKFKINKKQLEKTTYVARSISMPRTTDKLLRAVADDQDVSYRGLLLYMIAHCLEDLGYAEEADRIRSSPLNKRSKAHTKAPRIK